MIPETEQTDRMEKLKHQSSLPNELSAENCYTDPEVFNQFLQCCFDPRHLHQTSNLTMDSLNLDQMNANVNMNMNMSMNMPLDLDLQLPDSAKDKNDSSTIETSSIKTNPSPNMPLNLVDSCCLPIDLNPCCAQENHHGHHQHPHPEDEMCNHSHGNYGADLSEMIILNNFFSACCDEHSNTNDLETKYPSAVSPVLQSNLKTGDLNSPAVISKSFATTDNISSLRDSLKFEQKSQHSNHHHHLLHLHHHNPDNAKQSHTHDIIFHHHNSNNCQHNNHINHHHHLHFEDEINGQKVKHDFILPDCDVPNSASKSAPSKVKVEQDEDVLTDSQQGECTDFLTSSICNIDSFNNFKPSQLPRCDSKNNCAHNHSHNHQHHCHHQNSQSPNCNKNLHSNTNADKHNYCQLNFKLPSQNYCKDTQSLRNCCDPSAQAHHFLQHHYHKFNNGLHQQHFHENRSSHPNAEDLLSLKTEESYTDLSDFTDTDLLTCKWNKCNEKFDSEDLEKHIYENHLQNVNLSPGTYMDDDNNRHNMSNSNRINSLQLHCEWDDCDFFTTDVNKFLEHVPEHTEVMKRPQTCSESENNGDNHDEPIHKCLWRNPITGEICGKIFQGTEGLTQHLIDDHISSGKSSYVCHWDGCNRCGKEFSQRQKIIRHLNTHTKHKPFECEICHKRFSLDLMLKQHMRIHTGEKPYKCDICGKTFKTSSSLTIHLRIHSGDKPMVCKICGKRFNESSNLNKHMKIHFREHKCEHCMKSFDSITKFNRHKLLCKKRPKV